MNVTINARQITIYDDLKELIAKKLAKFDRYFPGGADASANRLKLLKKLNLPERMSPNAMLQALNLLYNLEELQAILQNL